MKKNLCLLIFKIKIMFRTVIQRKEVNNTLKLNYFLGASFSKYLSGKVKSPVSLGKKIVFNFA